MASPQLVPGSCRSELSGGVICAFSSENRKREKAEVPTALRHALEQVEEEHTHGRARGINRCLKRSKEYDDENLRFGLFGYKHTHIQTSRKLTNQRVD